MNWKNIGVKCDNIIQLQITLFQLFLDKKLLKKEVVMD